MRTLKAADLFCGAGGSSTGLKRVAQALGVGLDLTAVNHWPTAVETHAANHPEARHVCQSVDNIDPRKVTGGTLDLLWASPECTHHSTARGGMPINDQSRATAWCVTRWAEALRPAYIVVENVPEFQTWGPLGTNERPLKSRKGETFAAWMSDILPGFKLVPKPEWQVNRLYYQYARNYMQGVFERGEGGGGVAPLEDETAQERDGVITKTLSLDYIRDDATAQDVAARYLELFKVQPTVVQYTRRGLCGLEDDVLDGVPITHWNGDGPNGWQDHAVLILSKTFDWLRGQCSFTALDVERLVS